MRKDSFAKLLVDKVLEIREDVVEEMAPADNPVCELCESKKFQIDRLDNETKIEFYAADCPREDCEGILHFSHIYVCIGNEVSIVNREFAGGKCTGDGCSPSDDHKMEAVDTTEPFETEEYALPVKGIVTEMIHEHHISYEPEETIPVCASCHSRIHNDDDFHPELTPDMGRSEWDAKNA